MSALGDLAARRISLLAALGLAGIISAGHWVDFGQAVMRPLSLAACLVLLPALRAAHRRKKASPIDGVMVLFCLVSAVGFWLWPGLGRLVSAYPEPVLYALFLAMATLPQLSGRQPFTVYFAQKRTPEAVRNTDIYRDINRVMSWTWAGIFALVLASTFFSYHAQGNFPVILLRVLIPLALLLGIGLPFTKKYPDHHQRRLGIEPVSAQEAESDPPASPAQRQTSAKEPNVMSVKMNIVAISGSPHGGIANTDLMIDMMRPVLEEQGFELEVINITQKKINYCVGCALCLEKNKCWQQDDHKEIVDKLLAADGIILGSPVYFRHVTAQMKTFIDRSLAYGHKPRGTWKPGLAVSVSAGMGETATANYLGQLLRVFGGWCVGSLTAIATGPGGFTGRELVEQRAAELALELAQAIKQQKRRPANDEDLFFWMFMSKLVRDHKDFMADDYRHWQEVGVMDSFEKYIGQEKAELPYDSSGRKAWLQGMIAQQKGDQKMSPEQKNPKGPGDIDSCREMIAGMPNAFDAAAAKGMNKVIQFDVTGDEEFTSHLVIADGTCAHHDGPAQNPDLVVKTPADVWVKISKGEMDGAMAFMKGKFKTEGEMTLLLKLNTLFGKR